MFKCHEPRTRGKVSCVEPRECEMNQLVATFSWLLAAGPSGAKATYAVLCARRKLSILVDVPRHTSWGSTFSLRFQVSPFPPPGAHRTSPN